MPRSEIDRRSPTRRPAGRAIGYQRWSDLLFLHWRVSPDLIEPLLPRRLSLDTWDGDAWIGLVPFHMSGVRPWWSPSVPGVSAFHETNVRTYVYFEGRDPGVWFFSLDAASSLAVRIARRRWCLNYFRSEMELSRNGLRIAYRSHRRWPEPSGADLKIQAEIGEPFASGQALPETLEFFLIERYVLYAEGRDGSLRQGRVHHQPYPLWSAQLLECEQTLLTAAGIPCDGPPDHIAFSGGVAVEIFPLQRVAPTA